MSNSTLGELARQEIIAAMQGLRGAQAAFQAERLATQYGCSKQRIYDLTASVRPRRKSRSDKGQREADLMEHQGLRYASELVVTLNYDPALALEQAQLNAYDIPISLGTFRRYLREHGISAAENARKIEPHRNFSARPGELFQVDLSGVKQRWLDIRTRRILKLVDVSKNHPNTNPNYIPIWKIGLIDDGSRYRRVRFIGVPKPTSNDVIDFLLECFREMGVPLSLYSDNDAIIISKRMQRAERILNEAFNETGGFRLLQHLPYNAKATGKIENTHKIFEKFERLIGGLYDAPTLENLNLFCACVCDRLNWTEHRTTGEKPALRFRATTAVMRVPPSALLDAAFKAKEFPNKPINSNVTISIEGAHYQLPRSSDFPFVSLAGTKARVTVVWPPDVDWFGLITPDGAEFTIERKLWVEDTAGEFKSTAESKRQRTTKSLKASAEERRKAHKERGTRPLVPYFDSAPEIADRIPILPRQTETLDEARLAEIAPGAVPTAGRFITYWKALEIFIEEGLLTNSAADKAWLKVIFRGREEMLDTELREEIAARTLAVTATAELRRA